MPWVVNVALAFALASSTLFSPALHAASRPPVVGTGGAVSSDERLATEAGLEILRRGGNATDAAVAVALALAVVGPEAGNLGGGGFAVSRTRAAAANDDGASEAATVRFLDFREVAPAAAHRDMYLGDDGTPVRDRSWTGPLAAGVPGTPTGLYELHRVQGELPWDRVVEPAIRLAREGFPLSRRSHASLVRERKRLARFPESKEVWFVGEEPATPGLTIKLPKLAKTLERYAEKGPEALVRGDVAEAIIETSSKYGGILTLEDLASYEPVWREPVRFEAFGWKLAGPDLPSSGGILMAASLWMIHEGMIQGGMTEEGTGRAEPSSADRAHLLAEAWRRAYADRYLLGDPGTTRARADDLTDPSWLARRWQSYDPRRATASSEVQLWSESAADESGRDGGAEPADTTHISVIDADGNAVSLTFTLNGLFGGALWVPGFGFLNNEMDDFAAAVEEPNEYGLVQGEANVVRPGKKMLSSMSPTVAWRSTPSGEETLVLGGRGGSRIPTGVLQVFLALAVDGAGLQEALDRPRIHHQWRPDVLYREPDALSPETRAELEERGHRLEIQESIAQVQAVRRLADGTFEAAGDPRKGGGHGGVVDPVR